MSSFDPFKPLKRQEAITMWTIAGGVCIGILTANAIEFGSAYVWAKIQIERAAYEFKTQTDRMNAQLRQQQADREAAEQQQRENMAQRQRAEAEARQAAIDAKAKRDEAWKNFYHRDPKCDNNPIDDATFTKCANDSVKAKTAFDAMYPR